MLRDTFERIGASWQPEKVIDDLILEEMEAPESTSWDRAKKELEDYFPLSIRSIGQLASFAANERTRLAAAKFIVGANIAMRKVQIAEDESPLAKMHEMFEKELETISDADRNPSTPVG